MPVWCKHFETFSVNLSLIFKHFQERIRMWRCLETGDQGTVSIKRCRLTSIGILMSHDRLIINTGISIIGQDGLYIATGPSLLSPRSIVWLYGNINQTDMSLVVGRRYSHYVLHYIWLPVDSCRFTFYFQNRSSWYFTIKCNHCLIDII